MLPFRKMRVSGLMDLKKGQVKGSASVDVN